MLWINFKAKNNIFIDLDTKENVEKRFLCTLLKLMKRWVRKFDWVNIFVSFYVHVFVAPSFNIFSMKISCFFHSNLSFLNWKPHSHSPSQSLVSLIEHNCCRELLFNNFYSLKWIFQLIVSITNHYFFSWKLNSHFPSQFIVFLVENYNTIIFDFLSVYSPISAGERQLSMLSTQI